MCHASKHGRLWFTNTQSQVLDEVCVLLNMLYPENAISWVCYILSMLYGQAIQVFIPLSSTAFSLRRLPTFTYTLKLFFSLKKKYNLSNQFIVSWRTTPFVFLPSWKDIKMLYIRIATLAVYLVFSTRLKCEEFGIEEANTWAGQIASHSLQAMHLSSPEG